MHDLLDRLLSANRLNSLEVETIFAKMLGGELSDAQIAAILVAWRIQGEGADELIAGARALRAKAEKVTVPQATRPLIDNCGTGGDGAGSFNISTAAAIVAASAGARVAKHGNRSVSSKCGSADLLFAAGFPDSLRAEQTGRLLEETGFTFFFAPNFHPVMRTVAPVRQSLGIRTIFNLLGPLANPIAPDHQVVGVGTRTHLRPVAEALNALGIERALVVHSRDGLDELSPSVPTDAFYVDKQEGLRELTIEPSDLGIQASRSDLAGGDATHNLKLLHELLNGQRPGLGGLGGLGAAVALNAGAVLWIYGQAADLKDGVQKARLQLQNGAARDYFHAWIQRAQSLTAAS